MFSSDLQLRNYTPTALCDLMGLVLVAYKILFGETPCLREARFLLALNPSAFPKSDSFKEFRLKNKKHLIEEMSKSSNPFAKLFIYLNNVSERNFELDYKRR